MGENTRIAMRHQQERAWSVVDGGVLLVRSYLRLLRYDCGPCSGGSGCVRFVHAVLIANERNTVDSSVVAWHAWSRKTPLSAGACADSVHAAGIQDASGPGGGP